MNGTSPLYSLTPESPAHTLRTCALRGRILTLRQDATHLHYRSIFPASSSASSSFSSSSDDDDTAELLHDYFNLSHSLSTLYTQWSRSDPNFLSKSARLSGVRMLRQDPWETVVSFICSSNNNIARISGMVWSLCGAWGEALGEAGGVVYHDFPPPGKLTGDGVEKMLRELGFGYRARYIAATAKIVDERGVGWLEGLRREGYRDAHEALLELPGVGPKVADCVCLMSLDKAEAVPVDTHGSFVLFLLLLTYTAKLDNSPADRAERLRLRQDEEQVADQSGLRRDWRSFSEAVGEGGRVGAFGMFAVSITHTFTRSHVHTI